MDFLNNVHTDKNREMKKKFRWIFLNYVQSHRQKQRDEKEVQMDFLNYAHTDKNRETIRIKNRVQNVWMERQSERLT